jgi:hypothetical protein
MLVKDMQDVDTVIEILKIPERHRIPGWEDEYRTAGGPVCWAREFLEERNWEIEGTLEGMTLCLNRVSLIPNSFDHF